MKIYQMPYDVWNKIDLIYDPAGMKRSQYIDIFLEQEHGLKDTDRPDLDATKCFAYEIINEEKFAMFLLRFG